MLSLPGSAVVGLEGCQDLDKVVDCRSWEEAAQSMCVLLLSRCRCFCGTWSMRLLVYCLQTIRELPSLCYLCVFPSVDDQSLPKLPQTAFQLSLMSSMGMLLKQLGAVGGRRQQVCGSALGLNVFESGR